MSTDEPPPGPRSNLHQNRHGIHVVVNNRDISSSNSKPADAIIFRGQEYTPGAVWAYLNLHPRRPGLFKRVFSVVDPLERATYEEREGLRTALDLITEHRFQDGPDLNSVPSQQSRKKYNPLDHSSY